jgi:DNA repair protein RadA/Sms
MKYQCANCETDFLKWEGRCSNCGEWGTLEESAEGISAVSGGTSTGPASKESIGNVSTRNSEYKNGRRIGTGYDELDRVLGGGLVEGEVVLLSGDPGIGKSTMLLQVALSLAKESKVLYVSGEESPNQLYSRVQRVLGGSLDSGIADNFEVTSEINTESVAELIAENEYSLIIVDSIQSMMSDSARSYAGSTSQVRISGQILTRVAKNKGVPIIIVGQINKDGAIAGPKVLEHTVDCVLYLEGDEYNVFRVLRGIKNRFGPTNEIGVFEMRSDGMQEVANPSQVFIQDLEDVPGSCVSAVLQGSRVVFVEVQALVVERDGTAGPLRRVANGFKKPRLDMLSAVLTRRGGVFLGNKDVFVNIVGGVNIDNPSIDLAVCSAIKSAVDESVVNQDVVYVGEVGLTGGIRGFYGVEAVLKESSRLGYKQIVLPDIKIPAVKGIRIQKVKNISAL